MWALTLHPAVFRRCYSSAGLRGQQVGEMKVSLLMLRKTKTLPTNRWVQFVYQHHSNKSWVAYPTSSCCTCGQDFFSLEDMKYSSDLWEDAFGREEWGGLSKPRGTLEAKPSHPPLDLWKLALMGSQRNQLFLFFLPVPSHMWNLGFLD